MSIRFVTALFTIATLAVGAVACSKESKSPEKAPAAASKTEKEEKHAPADVKPGSHEDWCAEHQVPESQCTRCDAELIAAFKATGDWCPEHGLPESQCLECNPDLKIVRPPKPEGN